MTVRNTWEPIDLNSEESNHHLAAWKYEGKRLAFEVSHSLTDGAGVLPYIKSTLYLYISRKTGLAFDPDGFRLPGDDIPESETGNPFAGLDIDGAEAPLNIKQTVPDFYRLSDGTDHDPRITYIKHGYFNYYAELETAGKCFEWAMDHLALDEVGVYLEHTKVTDIESKYTSLYDYLSEEVRKVPPGANGVIFTPWLHGNRCPFEDSKAGGMFFNIRIENGKRDMIRAILEGICYHLRWLLECETKKVKTSDTIRFVGGGALSPLTCQMLADITGRTIETVHNTQEVGAIGTALVVAAGIKGTDVLELARQLVKVAQTYVPDPSNKAVYERNYQVFKRLYSCNAENFKALNHNSKGIIKAFR